jgi:hypothetical protein
MSSPSADPPDLAETLLELGRLRHRHAAAVKRRERLLEHVAWYPNGVNTRDLAALDAEQTRMEARIVELEARLAPAR